LILENIGSGINKDSTYWSYYRLRINVLKESDTDAIKKDFDELVRIFSSIRKNMKEKAERGEKSSSK
jgi:hypothetical protein